MCADRKPDCFRSRSIADGVELAKARISGIGFDPHRHDTYAIGITDVGAQVFGYRGRTVVSTHGQVVVLHPDETHDGKAGDDRGLEYRIVYVCPRLVHRAVTALAGCQRTLPFVSSAVCNSPTIVRALTQVFSDEAVPLASDDLVTELARGLLELEQTPGTLRRIRIDVRAIERAREFLDSELHRPVSSREIEAVSGLNRYDFSRQFRVCHATSPYRYSLQRRLNAVRKILGTGMSIAAAASAYGFADQAHLTRHFHSTFGVTPRRHRSLVSQALT